MERTNDALVLLGRLLMATLFLPSGIGKLLEFQTFAARPTLQALPFGGTAWAAAAVAIEVLVPSALIIGFAPRAMLLGYCRAKPTPMRFQALIAPMASVTLTISTSLNCAFISA